MKINTDSIIKQYDANFKNYKNLEESVRYTLDKAIKIQGIKIHSIDHRIKEISSLIDKTRRKKIENPIDQLHDLVGFRVVCLFLPDVEEIEKIIRNEFAVFEKDDKVKDTEQNIFGYMSLHLKARIKQSQKDSRTDELQNIPFEIQIRTIAQDAWASISHYLDYKKKSILPEQLKRDFYALSGLFYVADTHFSLLRQEQSKYIFGKSSKKITTTMD